MLLPYGLEDGLSKSSPWSITATLNSHPAKPVLAQNSRNHIWISQFLRKHRHIKVGEGKGVLEDYGYSEWQ